MGNDWDYSERKSGAYSLGLLACNAVVLPLKWAFIVWAGSHVLQWLGCAVPHG